MAKSKYIQANKEWLAAKAKEDGVKALPHGIYYKVIEEGDQSSATPTVRNIVTAHYTGRTDGLQAVRPDRRLDNSHAADAYRRQVGGLHPCRDGLRKVFATRYLWRLDADFRD